MLAREYGFAGWQDLRAAVLRLKARAWSWPPLRRSDLSANATLHNSNGVTLETAPAGSPYINLNLGATVSVTLEFVDPTMQGISYSPRVLAGSGSR